MKARVLTLAVMACVASSAPGTSLAALIDVLGCRFNAGDKPGNFVDCINKVQNQWNSRLNDEREHAQREIDQTRQRLRDTQQQATLLEGQLKTTQAQLAEARDSARQAADAARHEVINSINYAKTSSELAALQVSRRLPFDRYYQCLARTGALSQFGANADALAADPAGAAHDMALRYWRAAQGQLSAISPEDLIKAALSPDPKRELMNSLSLGKRIAATDPVAFCAQGLLEPSAEAALAAGQSLHMTISQEQQQLFNKRVRPLVDRATLQARNYFLSRLRESLEKAIVANKTRAPAKIMLAASSWTPEPTQTDAMAPPLLLAGNSNTNFPDDLKNIKDIIAIDVGGIATQALVRGMLSPRIVKSDAAIANVVALLKKDPATVPASERAALLDAVRKALRADPKIRAAVEIEIMMGILKSAGQNFLGSSNYILGVPGGGKVVDLGMKLTDDLADWGFRLATDVGGTAPTGGSIISSVEGVYKAVKGTEVEDLAKDGVKVVIIQGFKTGYGIFMDALTERIKADSAPSLDETLDRYRRENPELAPAIDFLQSKLIRGLAAGYVTQFEQNLNGYQDTVDSLVTTSIMLH